MTTTIEVYEAFSYTGKSEFRTESLAAAASYLDLVTKVRRDAVRSLGYMGAAARESVPQIKPLLDDPEQIVRVAAEKALQSIAPDEFPVPKTEGATPSPENPPAKPEQKQPSA